MRIQPLLFKAETLCKEHIRRYQGSKRCVERHKFYSPFYLDLVEVLASFERDHIVGGDASDWFICGVLRSVEC